MTVLSYTHFTLEERKYLEQLLTEDLSIRKIAAILERSPSSVSREINRNRATTRPKRPLNSRWYNHWRAQNQYINRRRAHARQALCLGTPEWEFIVAGLKQYWSPETICGRWHLEFPDRKPLCFSTIYRYIREKKFPGISGKSHLRRRDKRFVPRNSNYNTIHPDRIIPEWPEEIKNRRRTGDWEGDTVYGGVGKGGLATMNDRKHRLVKMKRVFTRKAEETRLAMEACLHGLPVNSISLDNGAEFAEFRKLEENLSTLVYFAEPHKPWQRGTNENSNGLIRFFFPKGFDFRTVTDEYVQYVEDLLNNRPRKCLGWKTPYESFYESVALA